MTSIIIPVYNNLDLTKRCIESIEKHTTDYEIIIVDDCSTDGTQEYFRNSNYKYYRNDKNLGFAQTCNLGMLKTDNDVVLLNNDTEVTENWLSEMLKVDAGIVGSCLLYPNTNLIQHCGVKIGQLNGNVFPLHYDMYKPKGKQETKYLKAVTGACMLIKRDVINKIGFLGEYKNGYEDIDYCLRAGEKGIKVAYCGSSVVYHYESMSQGRHDNDQSNYQKFIKRWKRPEISQEETLKIYNDNMDRLQELEGRDIGIIGDFSGKSSLSIINNELASRLGASKNIRGHKLTIRHLYPPITSEEKGKLVVIQPWEFSIVPDKIKKALSVADEVWTPSNYCKDIYTENGIENVHVIPNGTNYKPEGSKYPIESDKFKFLFVGGTIYRKGIDILLEAFQDIDATLVVKDMGTDTFYKNNYSEVVQQTPGVIYINDFIEIDSLYRACDCLVMPYRAEGFCMPVNEAIACGLPVIVTDGGATDDYVTEDVGWKVKSKPIEVESDLGNVRILEPDVEDLKLKMSKAMQEKRTNPERAITWDKVESLIQDRINKLTEV